MQHQQLHYLMEKSQLVFQIEVINLKIQYQDFQKYTQKKIYSCFKIHKIIQKDIHLPYIYNPPLLFQILSLLKLTFMELDLKQLDQTTWISYDLGEGSYYYGQVAYLDSQGSLGQQPNDKPIKHGKGVYIYNNSPDLVTRYEGSWANDLKHGVGKMVYEDGTTYLGMWKNGLKVEQGTMKWINGDSYEGGWKRDLMDGLGKFTHHQGKVLKGTFKCNYFIEGQTLRNPFLSEEEAKQFSQKRKNIVKIKQRVSKQQLFFFQRIKVNQLNQLQALIRKSNQNNRIPLIFSSTAAKSNISFFSDYSQSTNQRHSIFDLRKAYMTPKEQRQAFNLKTAQQLVQVLKEAGIYVINLDDSECQYNEKFYPNIKQYYSSRGLPNGIWSKCELLKPQIFSKLSEQQFEVSKDFSIVVWTKYRIDEGLENKQVIQKLQKRLQSVIPILKMDYIFLVN